MKSMKAFDLALPVTLSLLLAAATAHSESGPEFRDLQSQAMGRTGIASSKGATSLFLNPAALAGNHEVGGGLTVDLGVNSILLDYAKWAGDNYKYLNNSDSLLTKIGPVDNKWAPFSQSMLIYGNVQGIALAAVSDTRYDLTIGKAVVTPVPGVGVLSDLVLTAGRGFEAPEGYHFGFALKYIYRLRFEDRLVGTSEDAFYKVKQAWELPDNGWSDKLGKLRVAGQLADTKQGVGANFGAEKAVNENWTAGISLLAGIVFVLPPIIGLLPSSVANSIDPYLPSNAGGAIWTITPDPNTLAPWAGLAVFAAYAAASIAIAAVLLNRRDT